MLRFLLLFIPLLAAGCIGPGRHPHGFLPPIAEEYYRCEKCGSLHGGIYGKGPLASFATKAAASCWHRWSRISKTEFQKQAAADFPAAWAQTAWYIKSPP